MSPYFRGDTGCRCFSPFPLAFNQLAGINAILYYLNDILRARASARPGDLRRWPWGWRSGRDAAGHAFTIDRVGRRRCALIGSVGCAACLGGVAYIFFSGGHGNLLVWLLTGFIGFFGFSQGSVIWVYISEVFP